MFLLICKHGPAFKFALLMGTDNPISHSLVFQILVKLFWATVNPTSD